MGLPILTLRHEPTTADLLRLFHRTEALWVSHLSEPLTLEFGTVYCNPDLSTVWDANNLRDVALQPSMSPAKVFEEVTAHFASQGSRCAYWVMNPSATPDQTQPMIDHLTSTGHHPQQDDILHLRNLPRAAPPEIPGLKIIPARASYRHAEILAREKTRERWGDNEQLVAAHLHDIDNPHFDALLALKEDRAVATLGVLSAGDLGRIESLYVSHDFRRQGIARLMMARALEICARSLFKHVFILVAPDNLPAQRLYAQFGFEKIGQLTSYRPASSQASPPC